MKSNFWQRHPWAADTFGIFIFIVCVTLGTILINTFIFQSFTVVGSSMDPTFADGDKVIISRLQTTWANLTNTKFTPKRGEVIVFENPQYIEGMRDQYIIKRVIAFAGEKVKVENGKLTVYNKDHPNGFNPDDNFNHEPKSYTSHDGEWTVPEMKYLFLAITVKVIILTIQGVALAQFPYIKLLDLSPFEFSHLIKLEISNINKSKEYKKAENNLGFLF